MSRLEFSGRLLFWFAVVCFIANVSETRSGGRGGPRGSRGGFCSGSRYRSSRRISVGIGIGYRDHHRGGDGTSTAGMISGIVIAVIILVIFILVLSCVFCRCRSCNCKHTSSDEDYDIPTSKHVTSRYKASHDNNDDVTKPLSYDSAVNDSRAGYSAKDPGYSSTGYSTGTSNWLPYSAKPSGNSPYSVYSSAGYSGGTPGGVHYSSNPSSDYPAAGYSNAGLPYSAKPTEEAYYSAPSAPPHNPGNEPSAQIGFESMAHR